MFKIMHSSSRLRLAKLLKESKRDVWLRLFQISNKWENHVSAATRLNEQSVSYKNGRDLYSVVVRNSAKSPK